MSAPDRERELAGGGVLRAPHEEGPHGPRHQRPLGLAVAGVFVVPAWSRAEEGGGESDRGVTVVTRELMGEEGDEGREEGN